MWSGRERPQHCYLRTFYILLLFLVGCVDEWKIDNHLNNIVLYGHVLPPDMFISFNCLLFAFISYYKYLCVNLHPSSRIYKIHCFMVPSTHLLCDVSYYFTWDYRYNISHLIGIPTYIYLITKNDILLKNKGKI